MDDNKLAYPKVPDIDSFPKEPKKKRKKSHFLRRLKRRYKEWRNERRWKKNQKRKRIPVGERILIFLLAPIADFIEDIRNEKNRKKELQPEHRPNIFLRLYWVYIENREQSKESKLLSKKIRKSLSFDLEHDRRIFSLREEIENIINTWKSLPWNKSRELENILVTTLIILFSFSINYLMIQLSKFTVAHFFGIPGLWENGRVVFNVPDASSLWTFSSVLSTYFAGPLLVFISAMIFLNLHRKTKDKSSVASLTYLWMYLNAFVLFFGTYIAGIFTDRGFGYVMGWLFIPKYIEIPFGIFSLFMLWMIGFSSGKKLISFAPNISFYNSSLPQTMYKFVNIYIPVAISIIILLLIGFNNRDFTIQIVYLSLLGMLTPTLRFIPEKMM